jgi:hypothetical protein
MAEIQAIPPRRHRMCKKRSSPFTFKKGKGEAKSEQGTIAELVKRRGDGKTVHFGHQTATK